MAAPISSVVLLRRLYTRHHIFRKLRLNNGVLAIPSRSLFTSPAARSSSSRPPVPPAADEDDESAPLRYSTSPAASWRARNTFGGGSEDDDTPWYQAPSVLVSVVVLLIYFCVLREESDLDQDLGKTVWEKVPGLERQTLEAYVRHEEARGGSPVKERQRMEELQRQELQQAASQRSSSV